MVSQLLICAFPMMENDESSGAVLYANLKNENAKLKMLKRFSPKALSKTCKM
jgi:hypothetical protein